MKVLVFLLMSVLTFAQQNNTFDFAALNSSLIAPTINFTQDRAVFVANDDQFSLYLQGTLDVGVDGMMVAGAIDKSFTERSYSVYVGKMTGKFRGAIHAGFLDSFNGYTGTFAGFSFAWQPKEHTYIGVALGNLHSVSIDIDNDDAFTYYKKLTPKVYGSYEVIPNLIVFGQLSSRVNDIALKYQTKRFSFGGYYSGEGVEGLFGTFRLGRFSFLTSTSFEKFNFGLKFE